MKCQYCNSEWSSGVTVSVCPFCGNNLKESFKTSDISSALKMLIEDRGVEVLRTVQIVLFYFEAHVSGCAREKTLFKLAGSRGAFLKAYDIASEKNPERRKALIDSFTDYLKDSVFLSDNDASFIKNMILESLPFKTDEAAVFVIHAEESESALLSNRLQSSVSPITAGALSTLALKKNGGFYGTGILKDSEKLLNRSELIAISVCSNNAVGLKKDGTVVAVGDNTYGQCNVSEWRNIAVVSAGSKHTVGLKKDGTVVAVGFNGDGRCNVSGWKNIVAVDVGHDYTVGLKKDGTVVAAGFNGDGRCNVSGWSEITAISAGVVHTVGLKYDGTVVATGKNHLGQCNVYNWNDITAVSAGGTYTVGLRKDGTVVAVGDNKHGQCNVYSWNDITAISAGNRHVVGLKKDGMVVAVGDNTYGQCNISGWKSIVPEDKSDGNIGE